MGRARRANTDQLGERASWSGDGLVFSRCSGSARGGVCTPGLWNPQVFLANPCVQGFLFANSLPAPKPASPNNRESPSPKAKASGKMREGEIVTVKTLNILEPGEGRIQTLKNKSRMA